MLRKWFFALLDIKKNVVSFRIFCHLSYEFLVNQSLSVSLSLTHTDCSLQVEEMPSKEI